jgi:hypothetical protein
MTVLQVFAVALCAIFWMCGFLALLGFIDEMLHPTK